MFFGEDCKAMAVISEERKMHRMGSGGRLWNEEGGGAFRFKSTHRAPNTQERNMCTEMNIAREDEAERAQSQAGWPHLVRCGLRSSGSSSSFLPFSGIWVPLSRKGKREYEGEKGEI